MNRDTVAPSSEDPHRLPEGQPGQSVPAGAPDTATSGAAVQGAPSDSDSSSEVWRAWILSPPVLALGGLILICLTLTFLRLASPVLNPIMLAIFMVTLALPLYRWLAGRRIGKGLVLVAVMFCVLAIGLGIALLVWFSVNALLNGLASYSANIEAFVQQLAAQLAAWGIDTSGWGDFLSSALNRLLRGILAGLVEAASLFGLAAVLAAFLMLEVGRFGRLLTTSMRELPYVGMMPQVLEVAVKYFLIRIRLNVVTGALFGVALLLLGVDYALLWGLLTILLSFIPYIGLVLAAIPATLLALAEFGLGRALAVIIAVIIINFLVENVIAPSYTGKTLRLSAAVVFVSFLFWAWLLGPIGALLAMLITVLLMLTFGRYESTRWIAQLIGDEGSLPT